jgi:hypothetical protein
MRSGMMVENDRMIKNGEKLQLNSGKIEVWIMENEMKKRKLGADTQMKQVFEGLNGADVH